MTSPRSSCAVVLVRRLEKTSQVFLVLRSSRQKFFPGFFAFPGGGAEEEDFQFSFPSADLDGEDSRERATALREIFEETGLLVARPFPETSEKLRALRAEVLAGERTLASVFEELDCTPQADLLVPLGKKTTPSFFPFRHSTRFFSAEIPSHMEVELDGRELDDGFWIEPEKALQKWKREEWKIAPPVVILLRLMAQGSSPEEEREKMSQLDDDYLRDRPLVIPFHPYCELVPLKTETIPPATHTNCYFVGNKEFYIIDPGSAQPKEQDLLRRAIEGKIQGGQTPRAILLTHYHRDHVGGARDLAQHFDLPVYCHPKTAEFLAEREPELNLDARLEEGVNLSLDEGGTLEVLYTPGHSMDHVAFYLSPAGILFGGDLISTISSVIVLPPPKGDLKRYMESLHRLEELEPRWLFPAHGPPTSRPEKKIRAYIRHREQREEQLIGVLKEGKKTVRDLVEGVYAHEIDESMYEFATYNIQSGLDKLTREGKVRRESDHYYLS